MNKFFHIVPNGNNNHRCDVNRDVMICYVHRVRRCKTRWCLTCCGILNRNCMFIFWTISPSVDGDTILLHQNTKILSFCFCFCLKLVKWYWWYKIEIRCRPNGPGNDDATGLAMMTVRTSLLINAVKIEVRIEDNNSRALKSQEKPVLRCKNEKLRKSN